MENLILSLTSFSKAINFCFGSFFIFNCTMHINPFYGNFSNPLLPGIHADFQIFLQSNAQRVVTNRRTVNAAI